MQQAIDGLANMWAADADQEPTFRLIDFGRYGPFTVDS